MSNTQDPRERKSHGCLKALAVVAVIIVVAIVALVMTLSKKDEVESFTWPTSELVAQIPTPSWAEVDEETGTATLEGELSSESSTYFSCYVAASESEYAAYVAACEAAGFTVDYYKDSDSYSALNEAGFELDLDYYDEDSSRYEVAVMRVILAAPDEDEEDTDVETTASNATDTAEDESASDATADDSSDSSDSSAVDPDLKAWLDAYEAFMDSYVDFMLEYENASDDEALSMLADYTEMLTEYAAFAAELEEYDEDEMSAADLAYYLEVTTRIETRLLELYE